MMESRINLHDFPPHKRQCNNNLVDRISLLPDSILGVILSCLPTNEAVSTVLLSKRWNFLWRTVHNLHFCHEKCIKKDDMKFIEFVNRVLHLHDSRLLNKFSVSWDCRHVSSHTNSWINTALKKIVHNLSLHVCAPLPDLRPYDFPVSAFRCDSLQSLELTGMTVCVSDTLVVCLPRLESLKLDRLLFNSEEAFIKLISGCPILKELDLGIVNDDWIDFKCRISSASLRRLYMDFEQKGSLKLNAASLEYLNLGGSIREIIIESSLCSLVEAKLDLLFDDNDDVQEGEEEGISYNSIVEAIRAFGSVKVLALISSTHKALERATISLSIEFRRMVKLVAIDCRSLQDLINSADNLEVLKIYKGYCCNHPSKWITFVEVPRCFSNSLRKVKIHFLTYSEDDYEIIRLILEHGSRLEVLEICCGKINDKRTDVVFWLRERVELTKRILKFPRKSPACKVTITEL